MSAGLQSRNIGIQVERLLDTESSNPSATMAELARSLDMSARTLRRRLAEQETTFSEITLNWRIGTAKKLLRQRDIRTNIIARRLGYTHSSNFERAFKRWTGLTPSAYRNSHCDGAGPK